MGAQVASDGLAGVLGRVLLMADAAGVESVGEGWVEYARGWCWLGWHYDRWGVLVGVGAFGDYEGLSAWIGGLRTGTSVGSAVLR